MIVKIDKLKNFGIDKNFVWNRLDKFKQENLIYGWNYSVKTTFSNLFQNLEFKDKEKAIQDQNLVLQRKKITSIQITAKMI